MKKTIISAALMLLAVGASAQVWIRTNLIGYTNSLPKTAVVIATDDIPSTAFEVRDALTDEVVFTGTGVEKDASVWGMKRALRLPFSQLSRPGAYYIRMGEARSENFRIGDDIYADASNVPLYYMRQQRCGYNPYTDALCHQHDGFIVEHPTRSGEHIDVTGGWHDATDQLQYQLTSANATFQMLFAYYKNPEAFTDRFDAAGRKGPNGVPDILDEARWGLEWLKKMNPDSAVMFHQIADDRDHRGAREPQTDTVDYGWGPGKGRPVYYVSGEIQGLGSFKNRSTGVASSAGKFASAFAMGAVVFRDIDPEFARSLEKKAVDAVAFGESRPGACQGTCVVSPYFYEEDNYIDDMELAYAALNLMQPEAGWLKRGDYWGELEPITPWMETGKARHYQWYPFVNVGHYLMAREGSDAQRAKYIAFMREGLQHISERMGGDPFMRSGVPMVWCSNNFTFGALTQLRLYHELTGDDTFLEIEASLLDWIFGCNPWGSSMICGYPAGVDSPMSPHAIYYATRGETVYGGLVDGPVYNRIFSSLEGVNLNGEDVYAPFQNGLAVYHDDFGDFSSNEPTMDGTASMTYYLSSIEKMAAPAADKFDGAVKDQYGTVIRMDPSRREVYLVFTGDSLFEGTPKILRTLRKYGIRASWFLTGTCVRMHPKAVAQILKDGHYVGPHSNCHLLYADWTPERKSLVTPEQINEDLDGNFAEFRRAGIDVGAIRAMIPPYEHYNAESNGVLYQRGLQPVNLTPGTMTNADYTIPEMKSYRTADEILRHFWKFEAENGLNGALVLLHPGTQPSRKDKLYDRLGEMIEKLQAKGYTFASF